MSQLLPEGTLRRRIFETCDRALGLIKFWEYRPISNICGDQVKAACPCRFCSIVCGWLSKYVESDHCLKNAGKP